MAIYDHRKIGEGCGRLWQKFAAPPLIVAYLSSFKRREVDLVFGNVAYLFGVLTSIICMFIYVITYLFTIIIYSPGVLAPDAAGFGSSSQRYIDCVSGLGEKRIFSVLGAENSKSSQFP